MENKGEEKKIKSFRVYTFQIYSRGAERSQHRGRRLLHTNPLRGNADPAANTLHARTTSSGNENP